MTLDSKVARLRARLRHPTPIVAGTARIPRPPPSTTSPNPRDRRPWGPSGACQVLPWHAVSLASSLDGMGDDTFRCPQCQRELPYANDTYNPETKTCRACGRAETIPVQEAQAHGKSVPDVVEMDGEITPSRIGPARWSRPAQEEIPPPKVS